MLVRFNPWTDLSRLEKDVLSFLDARGAQLAPIGPNGDATVPTVWQPAVDVHEDASRILLVADLPGVEDKDVSVSVDNYVLTIKGERKSDVAADEKAYRRVERVQGAFTRSFTLPRTVDTERVGAEMKAGVLRITLPKKPEAQPRQIKVSVNG